MTFEEWWDEQNIFWGDVSELIARRIFISTRKNELTTGQLRAILEWRMCSDPWPGGDMKAVDDWLGSVCQKAGYQDWVDAYHALIKSREIFPGTLDALRYLGIKQIDCTNNKK